MKISEYNVKEKNTRDLSRTDLAHMVTNLRKELKEQIEENQELEKKVDGLVTVIDLAKNYIKHPIFTGDEKKPADILLDILEILEKVNEE